VFASSGSLKSPVLASWGCHDSAALVTPEGQLYMTITPRKFVEI
jgi:hypothetical protein